MWQSNCRVACTPQRSGGERRVRWHARGNIDQGVTLAEVYTAGGEALTGKQRRERELKVVLPRSVESQRNVYVTKKDRGVFPKASPKSLTLHLEREW